MLTPKTLLTLTRREPCELNKIERNVLFRAYIGITGLRGLKDTYPPQHFTPALNKLIKLKYIRLVKKYKRTRPGLHRFNTTPSVYGITKKGRKWVDDYLYELNERIRIANLC